MRTTSKGQVTIPAEVREPAGLLPNTEVDFDFDGKVVRIVPAGRSLLAYRQRGGAKRSVVSQPEYRPIAWMPD